MSDPSKPSLRRILLCALAAFWLGGLAFYASLVVPIGAEVLGSHLAFGLVTRQVAVGINISGACLVLLLAWDRWRGAATRLDWLGIALMGLCQLALFLLHPWLDGLIDLEAGALRDGEAFYQRHRIYLLVTGLQWLAGAWQFGRLLRS